MSTHSRYKNNTHHTDDNIDDNNNNAMAKSKGKRKSQGEAIDAPLKKQKTTGATTITPPPEKGASEPRTIQGLGLEQDDLEIAIDTLNTLAQNPGVIKLKSCKDLRTAVYEFRKASTTGMNASGLHHIP